MQNLIFADFCKRGVILAKISEDQNYCIYGYVEKEPMCVSYEEVLKILSSDNPMEYLSIFVLAGWMMKYNPNGSKTITAEHIASRLKLPISVVNKKLSDLVSNNLLERCEIEA